MTLPPIIEPVISIVVGILILVKPELIGYIVGIYLIVVGILKILGK